MVTAEGRPTLLKCIFQNIRPYRLPILASVTLGWSSRNRLRELERELLVFILARPIALSNVVRV